MNPALSRYGALASATFQQRLAYRSWFFITLLGQLMMLVSQYYLWRVLYGQRSSLGGYTWPEMQTYLLLTFFINAVITLHSELLLSYRILDGSVAIDLLKPLDYQTARLVETMAGAVIEAAMAVAIIVILGLSLGISLVPHSVLHGSCAAVSFILAVLVKFGVVYLSGMACFWTTNGWGISWAQTAVTQLFSGALLPLSLLPGWLRSTAECLPFQTMIYTPVNLFLGRVEGVAVPAVLLQQLAWAIGLWVLGRVVWRVMMRKVTIHGG